MTNHKKKPLILPLCVGVGLLCVFLAILIPVSIARPQHNLIPWQMAPGTLFVAAGLLGAFFLWDRLNLSRIEKFPWIYPALLAVFAVFLYVLSCMNRNATDSLLDYMRVWDAARELASGEAVTDEWYFRKYSNNFAPMLFLSLGIRAANALGFSDPFYFVLIFSVLETVGAVWAVGILSAPQGGNSKQYRILVALLFFCILPVYANTQAFYTDTMSFGKVVISMALVRLSCKATKRWQKVFYVAISAILLDIGLHVKITLVIPVIAFVIVLVLMRPDKRKIRYLLCGLAFAAVTHGLIAAWLNTYPMHRDASVTEDPIFSWVALGLKGDGGFIDNDAFARYMTGLETKEEKLAYTLSYIRENVHYFWDVEHLADKARFNFASGNLGAKDYACESMNGEENLIWQMFSPHGAYNWRISQICFCYMFAIYTIYLIGGVLTIVDLIRKRTVSHVLLTADIALVGNITFLMLWEANNRQMYNQMPMLLVGAVLNALVILRYLKEHMLKKA